MTSNIRSIRRAAITAALTIMALAVAGPQRAGAQQAPAAQAGRAVDLKPDLRAIIRDRVRQSQLTPDQIRARLRAEGFPDNLLDAYLDPKAELTNVVPTRDVLGAVLTLGFADSSEVFGRPKGGDGQAITDSTGLPNPNKTEIFGLSVFRSKTSQFDPNAAGAVDPGYRIGPGDVLALVISGEIDAERTLTVTRDGYVVIPEAGQVFANGLTLAQLDDAVFVRLARTYSGVKRGADATTRFSITVQKQRASQIFVVGDVANPGSYQIPGAGTVLTALYAAGGPTENGSFRKVDVRRGGKTISTLDLYDYLLRGDQLRDVRLESGDVVFVPVHGAHVRADGEVTRPAIYELKAGEALPDLLRAAGGFTATAARRRVQIERIVPPDQRLVSGRDRTVIDVGGDQLVSGFGPALPLQPGDVVKVFAVATRVRNRVLVQGNVWNPGPQGFTAGMKLSDAIRLAGGIKSDSYTGQVLVSRLQGDETRIQLRSSFRDSTGVLTADLTLAEDDEVRVFSVQEFRPNRYVVINGAVRKSGRVPYRDGMTVRDLILLAGGVEESAWLQEAELARLPNDRTSGATAVASRIPLDSSYLFERTADGKYKGPPGIPVSPRTTPEIALQPYDNVLIFKQPDWQLDRSVAIAGEVKFPGKYTLLAEDEKLADLVKRAGGLTTRASANGVMFYRRKGGIGRIGVNLTNALRSPSAIDNLILTDGDTIFVPGFVGTVTVSGAVNAPITVAYEPGKNLDYYVDQAGGYSKMADRKRAYVAQPNGKHAAVNRHWAWPDHVPLPEAGATVFVPQREDAGMARDNSALYSIVLQGVASLVALIIVATRK